MTTSIAPLPYFKDFYPNGTPLAGGLVYTYIGGTSTPQTTYTDYTGGFANTNPIVLNARGECEIWFPAGQAYKYVVTDPLGNIIRTVDQLANPTQIRSAVVSGNENRSNIAIPSTSAYLFANITGAGTYEYVVNFGFTTASGAGFAGNINYSGSFSYGQCGAYGAWSVDGSAAPTGQVFGGVIPIASSQSTVAFTFPAGSYTGEQTVFSTGVLVATTPGLIGFAWSQNVAQLMPTTLLAGSYAKLTQIA